MPNTAYKTPAGSINEQPKVTVIPSVTSAQQGCPLRVAPYARVSASQSDALHSFQAQMRFYKTLIQKKDDWVFVDIYADEAVSGTRTDKRDDFNRLMRDAEKGKIDHIITKSVARFCRNTVDCLEAVRKLTQWGVTIQFESDGLDTRSTSSEIILSILSNKAQNEALTAAKNMRKGKRMAMSLGTYKHASAPFGYTLQEGALIINPDQATIVRRIYEMYMAGNGTSRIANLLNEENISCPSGDTTWSTWTVQYILTNERYIGDALLQKTYQSESLPFRKQLNTGELTQYYYENSHDAIVDKDTFYAVNNLFETRSKTQKSQQQGKVSDGFNLHIVCGQCGKSYKRKRSGEKYYWVCRRQSTARSNCNGRRILESDIQEAFLRMFHKIKHNPKMLAAMLEQLYELNRALRVNNPDTIQLNNDIHTLINKNSVLQSLVQKGFMDESEALQQQRQNDTRILELRKKKNSIQDAEHTQGIIKQTAALIRAVDAAPSKLACFDKNIYSNMVKKIIVLPDGIFQIELANQLVVTETL